LDKENNNQFKDSHEELYLLFIDEERNKDLEKRFSTYINKYFNLDKKDSQNDIENMNNENEEKKENKIEPKVIKFVIN
jgi:hypothetical protein